MLTFTWLFRTPTSALQTAAPAFNFQGQSTCLVANAGTLKTKVYFQATQTALQSTRGNPLCIHAVVNLPLPICKCQMSRPVLCFNHWISFPFLLLPCGLPITTTHLSRSPIHAQWLPVSGFQKLQWTDYLSWSWTSDMFNEQGPVCSNDRHPGLEIPVVIMWPEPIGQKSNPNPRI